MVFADFEDILDLRQNRSKNKTGLWKRRDTGTWKLLTPAYELLSGFINNEISCDL